MFLGGVLKIVKNDEYYMSAALHEAKKALKKNEVPVGAVVVLNGKIVSKGYNENISKSDPCAHAEITAIRLASKKLENYRLPGCKLYVTLEPCVMCAGAMVHSRIEKVIYGATDPKTGACGSVYDITGNKKLNHKVKVKGGVLQNECSSLLKAFFKNKR